MEQIGKYRIIGELGSGGFGTVYKANDPGTGRVVAIKVLRAQEDTGLVKRFQAEARMAASLRHPNIVTVFDFGEESGRLFLVMEYLEGTTLGELIAGKAPLPPVERLQILYDAALGLRAAHEREIVHRDVKPANIMRLSDGSVKIMDFGISRAMGNVDTRLTQTGYMLGTPAYMAPEQFSEGASDVRCDIWAYGVVLYELLTGVNPYHAPSPPQIMYRVTMEEPPPLSRDAAGLPERLEGVMRRLLAKDRQRRYQSMEDVCFDLEAVLLELRRPQIEGLISGAEEMIRGGRLEEATGVVRRVLELDRANAWARKRRGELQEMARARELVRQADVEIRAGNEAGGMRHLEEALLLDPSNSEARRRIEETRAARSREAQTGEDAARGTRSPAAARGMPQWLWIVGVAILVVLALLLYPKIFPSEQALRVQPADLSFTYQQGGAPPNADTLRVEGKPAGTIWVIGASDPWINVNPAQLVGDGSIKMQVNPALLAPGNYSGIATVSARDGAVAPAIVRIHLSVTPDTAEGKIVEATTGAPTGKKAQEVPVQNPPSTRPLGTDAKGGARTRVNPADGLTYVFIPPGRFTMGCSPGDTECFDDEKPPHAESIANGFWLSQTEVTQAAWKKVMRGDNPSQFKGDQLPVESVDWNQASAYCKAIGGRIPTEREWEYAARAGTDAVRYGSLDAVAWYMGNSGSTTHPVALKTANAFGLYDMLGNIWEWTSSDYEFPGTKVVRGGSWYNDSRLVRASILIRYEPTLRHGVIGFRCVAEFR
jgi:formylglycine-generating enzyme required for sulfatase activity